MTFNLARLPEEALLVLQCRHGQASRADVAKAIIQQPAEYQAYFRDRLNHYREVKGSHEQ